MTIQRFGLGKRYSGGFGMPDIVAKVDGRYVLHSDYAALQSQDREDATASAMTSIADRYAHVMAMHLECILLNYGGPFSDEAMQTLSEYRDAMNKIHESESPTHMGEPLLDHARRIEGDGE